MERQEKINGSTFSHVVRDGCGSRGESRPGWLRMGLNLLSQGDKRADESVLENKAPAGPPDLEDLTRSDQICSLWRLLQRSEVQFWRDSAGLLLTVSTDALSLFHVVVGDV